MTAPIFDILMAEDDLGHATLVRRNLKRAGLVSDVVHVRDGQEALDYIFRRAPFAERPPHDALVLLLDLNMPRLGGMDVLRRLKDDRALTRIPVFVLTTTDDAHEIDRCYEEGAAACIVKPVDAVHFSEAVQRLGRFLLTARLPGETPPETRAGTQ